MTYSNNGVARPVLLWKINKMENNSSSQNFHSYDSFINDSIKDEPIYGDITADNYYSRNCLSMKSVLLSLPLEVIFEEDEDNSEIGSIIGQEDIQGAGETVSLDSDSQPFEMYSVSTDDTDRLSELSADYASVEKNYTEKPSSLGDGVEKKYYDIKQVQENVIEIKNDLNGREDQLNNTRIGNQNRSDIKDNYSQINKSTDIGNPLEGSFEIALSNEDRYESENCYDTEDCDEEANYLSDSCFLDESELFENSNTSVEHDVRTDENNLKDVTIAKHISEDSDQVKGNEASDKHPDLGSSGLDQVLLENSIKNILTNDSTEGDSTAVNEIKALKEVEGVSDEEIYSAVGSVRGIKNRVKERLLQFLSKKDEQEKPCKKLQNGSPNKPRESRSKTESPSKSLFPSDKVIIYYTSLGLIRKTKSDCLYVKNTFRNLLLKTEERDIVDARYRQEYRMFFSGLMPPQVIIGGKHVGGRREIEKLVETGKIRNITKCISNVTYTEEKCRVCGGHGYINCSRCNGSGRAKTLRYGASRRLNYLKCTYCKDGLLRCTQCIGLIN